MNLPPPDLPVPGPKPIPEKVDMASTPVPLLPPNPYAPPLTAVGAKVEERDAFEISESLGGLIREAFVYPLRKGGWGMLGVNAIIFFLISIAAIVPIVGWVVTLGGAAYIAAYYFDIISRTVGGESEVPPWPDLSSYWDDIIIPGAQMLIIYLVSSLPVFVGLWYFPEDSSDVHETMLLGRALKWLYFPMATLAVICHGSGWAALPHRVLPALIRCLPGYLVCAVAFALADLVHVLFATVLDFIPVVRWVLPWVLFVYVMMVQARLTGLVFLRYREKIKWG